MRIAGGCIAMLWVVACGGGGRSVRPGGADAAPEWVARGTGAFQLESGKQLQAVGTAPPSDPRTRRQKADQSAEQQMSSGIDALAAAMARLSDGSSADSVSTLTKKAAAQAAAIRDHWVTPDGTEQSLDVLDLPTFKDAVQKVDGDDRLKREVSANAERAFDTLMRP